MTVAVVQSAPRYAVYFAPAPETELWRIASCLLGYDAATGRNVDPVVPVGVGPSDWEALTEEPRRYGFHATLKAPFRLRAERGEAELLERLASLASCSRAFSTPLHVGLLDGFAAVLPSDGATRLGALADAALDAFEPLRAPLSDEEVARRRPESLSVRQRELLALFGYPYVREQFRFHMTLTGRLNENQRPVVEDLARRLAGALQQPTPIDRIALFRQDTPESRFRIVATERMG